MKLLVNYKGKALTYEIPDTELDKLAAQKPRTGYERVVHKEYFFVHYERGIESTTDVNITADIKLYGRGNYYTDERLACDNERADTLMRQLRRYAAENGGIPSVKYWKDANESGKYFDHPKFCIRYDYEQDRAEVDKWSHVRIVGEVYFLSEETCANAIIAFSNELRWYFTEYEAQLR